MVTGCGTVLPQSITQSAVGQEKQRERCDDAIQGTQEEQALVEELPLLTWFIELRIPQAILFTHILTADITLISMIHKQMKCMSLWNDTHQPHYAVNK